MTDNPRRALAEFLRTRRTRLRPQDVGLEPGPRRRVAELRRVAVRSTEFATLWARHDVQNATRGRMRVRHPLVGELNLDRDAYPIPGAPGPALIVCTAEPGGPDDERLRLLTGLLDAPTTVATQRS